MIDNSKIIEAFKNPNLIDALTQEEFWHSVDCYLLASSRNKKLRESAITLNQRKIAHRKDINDAILLTGSKV